MTWGELLDMAQQSKARHEAARDRALAKWARAYWINFNGWDSRSRELSNDLDAIMAPDWKEEGEEDVTTHLP